MAAPADPTIGRGGFLLSRLPPHAYVEARHSADYTVTGEELDWLAERVKLLQDTVAAVAKKRLNPANLTN
ncbi:hypothetical protein [Asticcacaulis sp.]|uniref:hypothetical protein n=1 Tax=Asticcacaulis sp. TaxID=1872648 RepID=UPI002615456C|nr:hypothetical protein [Asticcacaulis sp.]